MSTLELAPGDTAHIGRRGERLELTEWSRRFGDQQYSVVARTVHEGTIVQTEWMGTADNVKVGVMYETLVFRNDGTCSKAWHAHWPCTDDEAKAAHELVVEKVRRQEPPALSTDC